MSRYEELSSAEQNNLCKRLLIDSTYEFRKYSAELLDDDRFYADGKHYRKIGNIWGIDEQT